MAFDAVRLIEAKRDGQELTGDDLRALVTAYLADDVSDAQMSSLFMAGVLNGFSTEEAIALTDAYVSSGDVIDLSHLVGPTVDKHSTGGVADSTTFVVGPIVAACGMQLAKLSGRGLGHTGGTLDKLASIPGLRVDLGAQEVAAQVERIGLAVVSATASLAPADKRTYALRDVTGTVPSPALIAASIMSKKLAGGAEHIVLDVKTGDGAFLADLDEARGLARLCVQIGEARGRKVAALITDMSQPLGPAIGNALEIAASIDVLRGAPGALREVSLALSGELLELAGVQDGRERAERALDTGDAAERFGQMVEAQGGDRRVIEDPYKVLSAAPARHDVLARSEGVVTEIGCRGLGDLAVRLGAGRLRSQDPVDPSVGITVDVRIGDTVSHGQCLGVVHAADRVTAERVARSVSELLSIGESASTVPSVLERVAGDPEARPTD
ncbi:MAG: pyrimidine-nucleoside phosphorylase [Glaciecola sp.]|jgi:pyrimidine-nucleoside phosphorylase